MTTGAERTREARGFCVTCMATTGAVLALVVASFVYLGIEPMRLLSRDALHSMGEFIGRFFPPDTSAPFLARIVSATLQTLSISALGTLLAALAGFAFAVPASGRLGAPARAATRFTLNFLRSVPELVWAVIMVLVVGLGPFAGALALALHTTGVLGRLFGESLENADPAPAEALRLSGVGPALAFLYGTLPGLGAQMLSYTLYRWEMNIRMATVLGFVGAGGLGQMLYYELSLLHEPQACTVMIGMLVLVLAVDGVSNLLRRRRLRGHA